MTLSNSMSRAVPVKNQSNKGFTVIELMVTIAVVAILLSVAVPSFWTFIQSNRVTAQANELVTALGFARSEAVKRGEIVSLCMSNQAEPPACATGGSDDWSGGWLAFVNPDQNANYGSYANDVLRVWPALPDRMELDLARADVVDARRVDFLAMGNVDISGSPDDFRFQWTLQPDDCKPGRPFLRLIDLSSTGRSQIRSGECEE